MTWLLNEDAGLKKKFAGLTVSDVNSPTRPVLVRFRLPENEFKDMTFPAVVIDHGGISKADDREHRGSALLPYAPEGQPKWADYENPAASPYWLNEWPIPYDLDYTITVYSRQALHSRALVAALAQPDRIPARFGYVEIPQDGTIRRLDLMGGPEPDEARDADGKRLFKNVYMVRVSSELLPSQVEAVTRVLEDGVQLDVEYDPVLSDA